MQEIEISPYTISLNLPGWTEKAPCAFQNHLKSGLAVTIASGTLERMKIDLETFFAAESTQTWQTLINKSDVVFGDYRALRVLTTLQNLFVQAQYLFELPPSLLPLDVPRSAGGGPARGRSSAETGEQLLHFTFTFAYEEEKRVDKFDPCFEGLSIRLSPSATGPSSVEVN